MSVFSSMPCRFSFQLIVLPGVLLPFQSNTITAFALS